MTEGISPTEVAKDVRDRAHQSERNREEHHDRRIVIIEAVLLAIVAVLAAWSGFASARWSTESSLKLAKASATRTEANEAEVSGLVTKNFDASTFNDWFTAYVLGNTSAMRVAENRFRPQFRVAFNAWIATDPFHNPKSPPGPTY
ncbi:MAG TPA: hypothetical protein VEJ87_05385, partial [Acidimicrobiales bacterium]|nr:hypothetical protein [Acidimicrobiales bacterium]